MKRVIILVALFAALGTTNTQAQYRQDQTVWGSNDNTVYRDERGEYRWEIRERRVWIPEYRTAGIFGIGSRRIPGHYEMRRERVKAYLGKNKKQHPHGMPPGQRKKYDERYDPRYERNDRYENDRRRGDRDDDRYERDRDYDNRHRSDRDDDHDDDNRD